MKTKFNTILPITDTHSDESLMYDGCFVEHIDTPNNLKKDEIIITKKKLLEIFAKSLGVENAEGWSTGQLIIKHLFGE